MSKKILIVESDTNLSSAMREALEAKGFGVDETTDGKGSVEQIRRERPDLVVLAVDLSGGQNGYLICGKLKKDDDLKNVPVVIIGNPDGFAAAPQAQGPRGRVRGQAGGRGHAGGPRGCADRLP